VKEILVKSAGTLDSLPQSCMQNVQPKPSRGVHAQSLNLFHSIGTNREEQRPHP